MKSKNKPSVFQSWALMNSIILTIFIASAYFDYTNRFFEGMSWVTVLMVIIFILFQISIGYTARQIDKDYDQIGFIRDHYSDSLQKGEGASFREALLSKLTSRIDYIALGSVLFVTMGLLGTAIGFASAFDGFSFDLISNDMIETSIVSEIFHTLSKAINSAIIGIGMMVWNAANFYVLSRYTEKLMLAIVMRH